MSGWIPFQPWPSQINRAVARAAAIGREATTAARRVATSITRTREATSAHGIREATVTSDREAEA